MVQPKTLRVTFPELSVRSVLTSILSPPACLGDPEDILNETGNEILGLNHLSLSRPQAESEPPSTSLQYRKVYGAHLSPAR
jgi:hypothetical protein